MAVVAATQSRYFISNPIKVIHKDFIKSSHLNRRRVKLARDYTIIIKTLFTKIFKEIVTNGYEFKYRALGIFYCAKYLPSSIILISTLLLILTGYLSFNCSIHSFSR